MSISTLESTQSRRELDEIWRHTEEQERAEYLKQQSVNDACHAIRYAFNLDCKDVQQILCTLAMQMKSRGFADVDIDEVIATADFIGGA